MINFKQLESITSLDNKLTQLKTDINLIIIENEKLNNRNTGRVYNS